jgi:hypothetical protein
MIPTADNWVQATDWVCVPFLSDGSAPDAAR